MLDILAKTYRTAARSDQSLVNPAQSDDTARRYPWRGHRWGNRRNARTQLRRMKGMSDHMLNDIGLTRDNIDRLFD